MFRFQHTEYLIALVVLLPVGALLYFVLQWKKKTIRKIGDESLVRSLISQYSQLHFLFKFGFLALALAALIVAAANLQQAGKMENISRKGVDVVIAIDVSKSMLAEDIKPNRLEKARALVYKLMERLPDDRVGLVLFAGRAFLQMPLSTDHSAARMYLQQASPDVVPVQGTVVAEALRMSANAFNSRERKFKSIVLITDGEDHDPQAIPLAQQLAGDGVIINTVGIGSPEGTTITDPATGTLKKDQNGNTVISKLNELELMQLAAATSGVYVRLNDIDQAVNDITQQLNTIEKTSPDDSTFKDYLSYFQWFLALALILLVGEFFFPERKWRTA